MISWILKKINRLPRPWNIVVGLALLAAIFGCLLWVFSQIQSCTYRKARTEYQAKEEKWKTERTELIGENKQLREHVAKLSAEDEGLKAIIESRGGQIAAEAKNLEHISNELKKDLSTAGIAADPCVWCRQLSANALARKQIAKPFACKDECAGVTR